MIGLLIHVAKIITHATHPSQRNRYMDTVTSARDLTRLFDVGGADTVEIYFNGPGRLCMDREWKVIDGLKWFAFSAAACMQSNFCYM